MKKKRHISTVIKSVLLLIVTSHFVNHRAFAQGHNLTVIPPGPVTDKIKVEIRLTVYNSMEIEQTFQIRFYWDKVESDHFISHEAVTIPAGGFALVRTWWETAGHVGNHNLLFQVESNTTGIEEGSWPLEVVSSETSALPLLQGGWCDPGVLLGWGYPRARVPVEQDVRDEIDAMKRIGMNVVIITYVEFALRPFYPSEVLGESFFDFDVIEAILSQADQNGMHVFLGLGRGDDTYLLWNGLDDSNRIRRAIDLGAQVARELWQRYHHHRSFYGWYFTHEMNDLAKASAYYNALADTCHAFAPDKPVMVAPAGTPIISPQILNNSHIDIFAYQDAVGAGYKNYQYTLDPEIRIADLDSVYAYYRDMHEGTHKHFWTDLEIWRANPVTGYTPFDPAPFDQVKRQIEIEAAYVEMITAYEFFSMMEFPESTLMLGGEEAVRLYNEYLDYYNTYRSDATVVDHESQMKPTPIRMLYSYPNPFNPSTTIHFELTEPSLVSLRIYNMRGRIVRTLLNSQIFMPGSHQIEWDGRDDANTRVATGMYLLECRVGKEFRDSVKMMLLK